MKLFTSTPGEFRNGQAAAKSRQFSRDYQRSQRKPRVKRPRKVDPLNSRVREIGVITPAQFQKGIGRGWRAKGAIKPLPEAVVDALLA